MSGGGDRSSRDIKMHTAIQRAYFTGNGCEQELKITLRWRIILKEKLDKRDVTECGLYSAIIWLLGIFGFHINL